MAKTYIENIKHTAVRNKIFSLIDIEKQQPIFEVIKLSSGDYLPTTAMINGDFPVYGGGGQTSKNHNQFNVIKRTFGIGRVGARCGCVFEILPNSWVTDNALFALDISPEYDINFLIEYLNFKNINQFANTSAQPVISLKRMSNITIPIIDLNSQKEIVEILENFENRNFNIKNDKYGIKSIITLTDVNESLSTELSQQLQLVKKLRQQLLQDAVQGKLVDQNADDEPANNLLQKIKAEKEQLVNDKKLKKEKELPQIKIEETPFDIPENWVWCRLGELCTIITKGSSPNWQGVKYVEEGKGILYITSKNVDSYKIDLTKATYVEEKFNEIEPRSILKRGDLLTNIVGASIGRTALFDLDAVANINQAVCILRIENKEFNKTYLLYLMNSDFALKLMSDSQFAPGRANLSMGNISNFPIPFP